MASGTSSTAQKHVLGFYKAEKFVEIDGGDYDDTITLGCKPGDLALDGMWRVDNVPFNAQLNEPGPGPFADWNTYNAVSVQASYSGEKDRWNFAFRNDAEDPAQLHIWVTCLDNKTRRPRATTTSTRSRSATPSRTRSTWAPARRPRTTRGRRSARPAPSPWPGYWADGGPVKIYRSWPKDSLRGWRMGFYAPEADPTVHTRVRCLTISSSKAGSKNHWHRLVTDLEQFSTSVGRNRTWAIKQDCGEQSKALVGAFDVRLWHSWTGHYDAHKLWFLGMEPQLKSRVFHVRNINPATTTTRSSARSASTIAPAAARSRPTPEQHAGHERTAKRCVRASASVFRPGG